MTSFTPLATKGRRGIPRSLKPTSFSLVEVVVAIGICTYALLILASLLPVGLVTIQGAGQQVARTEIYNQVWSDLNTTPYGNITNYTGFTNTSALTYYDNYGNVTNSASAVYTVLCLLPGPSANLPTLPAGVYQTNELNAVQVLIGYHVVPTTNAIGVDPRVTSRTFLISRRDGSGSTTITNGW